MISVIVPLYNKEDLIAISIGSVLKQSYKDYEIIVVNDGSTDKSIDMVKAFNDERIRIINQKNAGVAAARNKGIEEAKGEFIAFLDADDEWKEDYLATQMELAERYPQCDVFATNYEFCDANRKRTKTIIRGIQFQEESGVLNNYFEVASKSHPPICSISIMVRTNTIRSLGGFPIGIKSGEDLLTWARLAVKYKIAYSKKACSIYNVPNNSSFAKPTRVPQLPDVVGSKLKELYLNNKKVIGLKQYVGLWHKMRASIYLRLNRSRECNKETFQALHYMPSNLKLYLYLILNILPQRVQSLIN